MSPRSLLLCALIAWALSNEPALLAQSNDNFSDRLTLGGMSATAVSNNLKATAEPGEPNHAGQSAGRSLWWSWKAPGSGPVNFSLFDGGAMPNVVRHTLAVYTGDSLDNLSQVAATSGTTSANLSNSGSGIGDYSVSFQAVAGTVYQIAVDDYNAVSLSAAGSDSTVVLGINQAPVIVSLAALTTTLKNNFFYTIQASNQPTDYAASGLPPGLAINPATGYISGTPSATGTFPVQLSAANAGGAGTGVLTLTVNEASSSSSSSTSSATKTPPGLTSVASARGVVGAAFSLAATVSGADTGSLRVTGLPPGLDYDDFFNSIAGIPTAPGVYPVTFSASNAGGAFSAVVTVVIAAKPNLPVVSSALAANATVGKSFNYYIGSQTYDAGGQTRYGATNLPPGLGLDGSSGIIGGAPTTAGVYAVSISATNAAGTSWAVVTITVDPADASAANAAPFFTGTAIQSFQINVPVSTQLSAINSPASFTASNLPPGLSMNLANGYLVGTPTALGEYRVPISATNAYGTANVTLTIRVTAFAPSTGAATVNSSTYLVGSAAAAAATVGSSFSYTIALSTLSTSATGATPSYLYAYTASTLPDGLIFNPATGVISGTPTAAGTYSIDLGCSYYPDSAARTLGLASSRIQTPPATLTLVVAASAAPVTAPPLIVANANVSVTAGNAFYYYLGATNGGTAFTASGLPAGTSISASAGTISGTPTAAGTYAVNVTAANAVGTGAAVVTFVVAPAAAASAAAPPPPQINTDAFTSGTLGSSFGFSISATNSPTAYAASGLPPGLAVNSASGYISGTPTTAGEYNVTLSATNAVGTATAPLALRIDPISAPVVSSASSAAGYVGAAFSYSISRSGSSSVTGYSASNLPPGLSLSSASGAITGTPTTAGVYAVPVSVTTAAGVANATVTITIAATPPAPIMSGKAVYNGAVGQGFSYSIPPSGASGGYTAANLPGGLTLNASTGAISGTPTAAGTYLVPISATTAGGTSNATVTFAIAGTAGSGQAPVISSPAATYGQVNAPFSYQITAANSPTSFDASALPPGLTINPATGVISGTPTAAGTYAVNVAAFNANPAGSNAGQAQVTMVFSGSLTGSPVISSPALYSGDVGAAFAYQIAASDYPTSFSAASIPSGLTLNSTTGLISGTPTQSGSYTVTLGAANALGSGSARVTLLLRNLPTALWRVTSSAAAVGVAGTAFSYTVTGNFSTASYPFYNPSGLPPGLTFSSSTSRLSGTPTVAGNYDVTFANNYASAVVRITILAASNANSTVPAFTNPASVNAFVGEPFSFALSATNNPASWSVAACPPG